jgi:hypothetical protein
MENRDYGQRGIIAGEAEDIVMFAADHPQARIERSHILGQTLTVRHVFNAALQLGDVSSGLGITPLLVRVLDDAPQIGFRRRKQDVIGGQARLPPPNSSSRMPPMLLPDSVPDRPSLIRNSILLDRLALQCSQGFQALMLIIGNVDGKPTHGRYSFAGAYITTNVGLCGQKIKGRITIEAQVRHSVIIYAPI